MVFPFADSCLNKCLYEKRLLSALITVINLERSLGCVLQDVTADVAKMTKDWIADDRKTSRNLSKQNCFCKTSMNLVSRDLLIY